MKLRVSTIILLFLVLLLSISASADTIKLQTANIENLGDSYVKSYNAAGNFGSVNTFVVGGIGISGYYTRGYIKFNLSSLPDNSIINSADLFLHGVPSFSFTVYAYEVNSEWEENTITWNNQPCFTGCNSTYESSTVVSDGWNSWNVSNMVVNSTTNNRDVVNIMLRSSETGSIPDFTVKSKEGADTTLRPYLNITYTEYESNPSPALVSWGNNKTNNQTLSFTINTSEGINLNVTANQTITTWLWAVNGTDQSVNYDNFSTSWATVGVRNVSVNGTNSNGTSNTIYWNVTVQSAEAAPQNYKSNISQTVVVSGVVGISKTMASSGYYLNGYVFNRINQPIANAVVKLGVVNVTSTDINGFYNFTNLVEEVYTFNASAFPYKKNVTDLFISHSATFNVTLIEQKQTGKIIEETPGFEGMFAILGLLSIYYVIRRKD